jgi:hypothetical protein
MARLTTPSGVLVRSYDTWLSTTLNEKGDEFFFFFEGRSHTDNAKHPHWWGVEKRFDEQGRLWSRNINRLVMDDFGTLVEVPA